MRVASVLIGLVASMCACEAFNFPALPQKASIQAMGRSRPVQIGAGSGSRLVIAQRAASKDDAEDITRKYGLEAGLFSIFNSKDSEGKAVKAKDLLAKYGSAYLLTSISLSIVSFGLCYALINAGVDVASLLAKVGINPTEQTETAGTAALAYAAHKAASPIRFPPTVALTPFVANALGKKVDDTGAESS